MTWGGSPASVPKRERYSAGHGAPHLCAWTTRESRAASSSQAISAVQWTPLAAAGKDVLVIGAHVARQCLREGLIDEIVVYLAPVLLGDGVQFFGSPSLRSAIRLEATNIERSGQLSILEFRVIK
jgi:dihydrofolate reductase